MPSHLLRLCPLWHRLPSPTSRQLPPQRRSQRCRGSSRPPPTLPALPEWAYHLCQLAYRPGPWQLIDMADILHAIELGAGEEEPINLKVGKGHQLTLSQKCRRREIWDFATWSQCFSVYAAVLAAAQPDRGADLMAYQYIIATAAREYFLSAFLAHDTAFRRKAAQYAITRWGEIDPHVYTRAFTSVQRPSSQCSICTSLHHTTMECALYSGGPAHQPWSTPAGPKQHTILNPFSLIPSY